MICRDCESGFHETYPGDNKDFNELCTCPCHRICIRPLTTNLMPPNQGKRDKIRPRHDLIPLGFIDELASIFEEGREPRPGMPEGYGDSWKAGGDDFLRDCLNHASNHLHLYMDGDRSENHLAKVAWNVLCVKWHKNKEEKKDDSGTR